MVLICRHKLHLLREAVLPDRLETMATRVHQLPPAVREGGPLDVWRGLRARLPWRFRHLHVLRLHHLVHSHLYSLGQLKQNISYE